MKGILKSTALSALRSTGVFSVVRRSGWRRQRLLVLCYHGLSLQDEHEWLPHLFITPELFRQRLACLRQMSANVLPLGEGLARLASGSLPEASVVITFDDGFVDFLKHGVPALAEFGFPATLYLTTHYMKHRVPIVNLALDYLLWKSRRASARFPGEGVETEMPLGSYLERQKVVQRILKAASEKNLDTVGKDEWARSIAAQLGVEYQPILDSRMLQILSADEIADVAKRGIDVQLHTHRHRSPGDRDLFMKEIQENRRAIHEITGTNPVHFCYPSGCYKPEFLPWLRECEVQTATTCERGLATGGSDPLLLPRVLDDSLTGPLRFQSFVSGLLV